MLQNPAVSVIIATYNRAALLRETIDSILNQRFRDFELIVVDDGSTDDTARIVRTFAAMHDHHAMQIAEDTMTDEEWYVLDEEKNNINAW